MFVKIILMDWERTQVAAGTADCRRRFWIRAREPSAPHHGHPRGGTVAAELPHRLRTSRLGRHRPSGRPQLGALAGLGLLLLEPRTGEMGR